MDHTVRENCPRNNITKSFSDRALLMWHTWRFLSLELTTHCLWIVELKWGFLYRLMCFRMVERQCCKIEKGEGLCINSRWYCSGAESWKQFCHECEASSSTWNIAHQKPTPSKQHNLLNIYKITHCKNLVGFFPPDPQCEVIQIVPPDSKVTSW